MWKERQRFYEFGPYRVDPDGRLLLKDQHAISLPPKVFETLLILVQHSGGVVLKDDLMKTLWLERRFRKLPPVERRAICSTLSPVSRTLRQPSWRSAKWDQGRHTAAGKLHLAALERDATGVGFALVARKAAAGRA